MDSPPDKNLLRGNLDLILLSILQDGSKYGLQIIQEAGLRTDGYLEFKEGSLYPALHRLEKAKTHPRRVSPVRYGRPTAALLPAHRCGTKKIAEQTRRVRHLQPQNQSFMGGTMNDTERYLRRATRGTWGRKRAEIREELAAHIDERVAVHRIGGLEENEAVEKALSELGEAGEVSAGMMRLHSMPTLLGSSLLCICAIALFLTSFSEAIAQQLNGSFVYPARDCSDLETLDCETFEVGGNFWVSQSALNEALESQGANVRVSGNYFRLELPDGEAVNFVTNMGDVLWEDQTVVRKNDSINLWDILAGFAKEAPDTELSVNGWEEPSVSLGGLDLNISSENMNAQKFYETYLSALLSEQLFEDHEYYGGSSLIEIPPSGFESLTLSVAAPFVVGDVYGLITMEPSPNSLPESTEKETKFNISVARSDASGQLEFSSNTANTTFLNTLPDTPEENVSLLVKLAGGEDGNWYEVIPPEAITVN